MSGDGAPGGELRYRARGGVVVERNIAGELPIAGPDIAGARDRAVIDIEQRSVNAETLRRRDQEALAHLGAGKAQRPAGLLDRKAAQVTPSFGLVAVEARIISILPISMSSSSAAICASAVTMPWPISTLPGEIATRPSPLNLTQDDSLGLAARLTGSIGAGEVMAQPSPKLRGAPRAPCGYAIRSGTGCDRVLLSPRPPSATDCASAGPPR